MRALLDTDVIFDFVLEREPFFQAARELISLNINGQFGGYISSITPVNLFYLGRKIVGAVQIRQGIADLLTLVQVCPITDACLIQALNLPFADYEDAVQHSSAAASGLDAIVTRNLKDYRNATLPVFSPTDFLAKLKSQPT
ncbi:MAG TPA: PIN domain-containing protein [Pyrinomonadaceae bacterium]|nr:PIN domain-containing protein [Pyrinomonadaceae bacterium]